MSDALTRQVVTFGRVLREAGVSVDPARTADALRGLERIDVGRREDAYWALRTTLVSRQEEIVTFDRAFDAWFLGRPLRPPARPSADARPTPKNAPRVRRDAGSAETPPGQDPEEVGTSAHEILRRRDFAAMSPDELAAARALMRTLAARRPLRRSRRLRRDPRGRALDLRALSRDAWP